MGFEHPRRELRAGGKTKSEEASDIMNIKANDLRPGDKIDYDNDIWVVKEVQHRTPGNLRAFVQAKIVSGTTSSANNQNIALVRLPGPDEPRIW